MPNYDDPLANQDRLPMYVFGTFIAMVLGFGLLI